MGRQTFFQQMRSVVLNPVDGFTNDVESNHDKLALLNLVTSAAASSNSADQVNINGRGIQVGVNITALGGTTPTATVTIQGKDAASGVYYTLLQSAALSAAGFTLLTVYPGVAAAANVAASQVLPATWRVLVALGGTAPTVSATVGASLIN